MLSLSSFITIQVEKGPTVVKYRNPPVMSDAECQALISAPELGRGGARTVYPVDDDGCAVIKKINVPFVGANVMEWHIWCAIRDTDLAPSFGQCKAISESGRFLVMERLDDISESDRSDTPAMPQWVGDVWWNNFGKNHQGQIKMRDYANVALGEVLASAEKFRRAWQFTS